MTGDALRAIEQLGDIGRDAGLEGLADEIGLQTDM